MRADKDALAALDAQIGLPDRDLKRNVALLPLGCSGRIGAICRQSADGEEIALTGNHGTENAANELRSIFGYGWAAGNGAGHLIGDLDFMQMHQGLVHGVEVAL